MFPHLEHLLVRLLVDEASDVVQGSALFLGEIRRAGIREVQGDDQFRHGIEQSEGRGGFVLTQALVLSSSLRFRFKQFGDRPFVDAVGSRVHGDADLRLQPGGRIAGVKQGGHVELPGEGRHVSGDAAEVRDNGRRLGHEPDESGRGPGSDQHGPLREPVHISFLVHEHHRTGSHSWKGRFPSFEEERVSFHGRGGFHV